MSLGLQGHAPVGMALAGGGTMARVDGEILPGVYVSHSERIAKQDVIELEVTNVTPVL